MTVLLFGGNGQVGHELRRSLRALGDVVVTTRSGELPEGAHCEVADFDRPDTLAELVENQPSHIECVVPAGATLPLAVASTDNGLSRIDTDNLQRDLTVLLDWARDEGLTLDRLTASHSSLDDIFRSLGR